MFIRLFVWLTAACRGQHPTREKEPDEHSPLCPNLRGRSRASGRANLEAGLDAGWCRSGSGSERPHRVQVLRRFKLEGEAGLADRSSRPLHSPTRLQLEKADIVLELRREKRMTAAKIAAVLRLARSTVARLLKRNHLGRLRLVVPQPEPRRYEWPNSGDMVHNRKRPHAGCGALTPIQKVERAA